MYEVQNKDTIKYEIQPHLSVAKRGYVSRSNLVAVIQPMPYKLKTSWPCPITSAFPWCCLQRPWAACPTTARASGSKRTCFSGGVAQRRVCGLIIICLIFSNKFNIKSGLFVHQPPTLPQKIDSRGGLFWCQKGLVVHAGKMNFYLSWPPPTPVFGPFAAKCNAFWC